MEWPHSHINHRPSKWDIVMAATHRDERGRRRHVEFEVSDSPLHQWAFVKVKVEILAVGERRGGELDLFLRQVGTEEVYHYLLQQFGKGELIDNTDLSYLFRARAGNRVSA